MVRGMFEQRMRALVAVERHHVQVYGENRWIRRASVYYSTTE